MSPVELMVQGKRLFNEYEGAFVENYVAQQLVAHFPQKFYYWRSKGGRAGLPGQTCLTSKKTAKFLICPFTPYHGWLG